jgi:hypothetical protein
MMSQVKNSNSSKSGLTAKRSYRWLAIGLTAVAVFLAGCEKKDPYVDPGTTENPNWVLTVDTTDLTASMTAVVKVSFAPNEGTLAAFMGEECCGIADYNADLGLYWLYISPATEQGGNVQLRFYSPDLKRIFDATSTFPFRNDTQRGTVAEPYTPEWEIAK